MSKKKTKLQNGKFYMAYGGNSHPAQVYEKTRYGTYKSIKTGTTGGKGMEEIRPTQKGYAKSFIHKRPFEGTRRDYGDKELLGITFDPEDKPKIEMVKKRKSTLSRSARKAYKK